MHNTLYVHNQKYVYIRNLKSETNAGKIRSRYAHSTFMVGSTADLLKGVRILFAGPLFPGSTSLQRLEAIKRLGAQVIPVDTTPAGVGMIQRVLDAGYRRLFRLGMPIQVPTDRDHLNQRLISVGAETRPDLAWIEKGTVFRRSSLNALKHHCGVRVVVGFSPDDMAARHTQTQFFLESLRSYDLFVTTKSFGVTELQALGARRTTFLPNAYDPMTHRPPMPSDQIGDTATFGFIGRYEPDRYRLLSKLAESGYPVRVIGMGRWPRYGVHKRIDLVRTPRWGAEYTRTIWSTQVNLCCLSKLARDRQTTRSIEIPACAGFMLAERTDEHRDLFREGVEADYFSTADELIQKARYYASRVELCRSIGLEGRARCERSGYSYDSRLASVLVGVMSGPMS